MKFSDIIKELRKSQNLKQTDIADILGISSRNYQEYEYGKVTPNAVVLNKLADHFNVSTDYLLGRSEIPNIEIDEISLIKKIDEVITTANELKDFIEKN